MYRSFEQKTLTGWLKRNRKRFSHPPCLIRRRNHSLTFRFTGVTPRIQFVIRKAGMMEIWVRYKRVNDILTDFDVVERRASDGRYHCDLCLKEGKFPTREALWENHFEFMLQWANENLQESQWLCFFATQGGSNWVEIRNEEDARKSASNEDFFDACSVVLAGNSKSKTEKSL